MGLLWLQTFLAVLLSVAGLAWPLAVVGFEPVRAVASADRSDVQRWLVWLADEATWQDFVPRSPALIAALVGLVVLWTLALFVYCGFQAGLYGVLTETRSDRALDLRRFAHHGRQHLWRFFGLIHAFLLYLTGVLFLWTWVVWLAVWAWIAWGPLASIAIGLGGLLPVGYLGVVVGLWFLLSRADVTRPGSGVRPAQRRGWQILRRRPGAVTVLGLLFVVLSLVAGGLLTPLGFLAGRWLETGSPSWWIVRGGIEMASWGLYAALAVFVSETTVSFVQGHADLAQDQGPEPSGSED